MRRVRSAPIGTRENKLFALTKGIALKLVSAAAISLAVATAFACSSSKTSDNADSGPPPVAAGTTLSMTFGPLTMQPGEEHTKCMVKRLGNDRALHVGTIHDVLSQGSHHMIVYKSAETEERTTPFDCTPFTDTLDPAKGSTLVVTQKHDDTLQLPQGVAFALEANQMIRLEVHYINTTTAPLDITATTTLVTMDETVFKDEADFLFIGSPDITVPPNSKATLGPVYFPLPPEYSQVKFFAITGHEHQYGTNVTVNVASSKTDVGKSVYDVPGWLWSEPATVVADPPFTIPQGGGFRFTCEWNNTSASTLKFGESANNEMCFFWAYYYPSQGSKVCMHTDRFMNGIDLCCPGPSLYCAIILDRLRDGGLQ